MSKQKSIEDYRNAVKLLKLKVIKLQKVNEELTEKLREQGIPIVTDDGKGQGTLTNQNVMQTFGRTCKRLGLTPEMLFRSADIEGTGSIKVEDFRLFLSKVRLGLNQAQITLIVRILDEDCSGVVRKEEYYECLQAYSINEEKSTSGTRTYGQTSLLKFGKLLLQLQISPEDSWNKMDPQAKGTIIPSTFSGFVHAIDSNGQMNEKEIVATYNHIDLDKQGTLQKTFYEQEVRKAMKAAANDLGMNSSAVLGKTGQQFNVQPSPGRPPVSGPSLTVPSGPAQGAGLSQSQALNDSQQIQTEDKRVFDVNPKAIAAVVSKLQAQGIDIIAFIRGLMEKLANPAAGVMLYDVYKAFDDSGKKIAKSDQLKLFQTLDIGSNGSVDYDELMVVYLEVKKASDTFDGLFEILTRKLQALELDIGQYLSIEQVYEDTEFNEETFFPIAEILFMVPNKDVSTQLYNAMNTGGQLTAIEIINAVRKIMDIYVPPKVLAVNQTMNQDIATLNLDEYNKILRKMKPVLTEEDYFDKRFLQGKKIVKRKWQTIFNTEIACLRRAYEIIGELDKTPGSKWSDPEFGATPTDQYGSKSMYFADNDIPEGCPDPKEVKWLRPEEILASLVDNGFDDLEGKTADIFDADGAGANDVCQSKYLGNCWFVSALSIIARYDKYLRGQFVISEEAVKDLSDDEIAGMRFGVYPPAFQFLRKYGIYVMRFYKNFGWRYVMIDDRLCFKDNDFVYGKCRRPTELWVNFIEKAYAKIHNCYYAMTSGDIAQGLSDMTGLVGDKTRFEGAAMTTPQEKDALWNSLVTAKQDGTMMGCSAEGGTEHFIQVNGEDSGVMSGHAYGVIDVFELPYEPAKNYHKSHRLIILRNPWGYGEWKLKWSDNPDYSAKIDQFKGQIDAYYDVEIKKAQDKGEEPPERYKPGVDDGTFIMCFRDWRKVFCNLFQCINFPEVFSGMRGKDKFGFQTSGVPKNTEASKISFAMKNPQYIFEINRKDGKDTLTYIQFKQLDGRLFWAEKYPYPNIMRYILLCVFKLEPNEQQLAKFDPAKMIASSKKVNLRREVDSDYLTLKNGRYCIIPCTKNPGDQADFSINVYYDCSHEEMKCYKFGDPMFQFQVIQELEESVSKAEQDVKTLLKKQALDVLAQITQRSRAPSQSGSPLKQK